VAQEEFTSPENEAGHFKELPTEARVKTNMHILPDVVVRAAFSPFLYHFMSRIKAALPYDL